MKCERRAEAMNREAREFSFVFSRELVAGGSLSFFDLERARKLESGGERRGD